MVINRKYVVFAIVAIVFTAMFFRYMHRAPKRHYSDFRVYYKTAQTFAERSNIYSRPDESITPFKYSPMFAFLMWPLSFFSQKTASLIFFTLNFILLVLVVILSGKLVVKDKISYRQSVFLCLMPILFTFRFILQVLDSGQIGIMMFFLVLSGLYFLDKKKDYLGSASIALSAMFKYTSFVFLPYFLLKKRMKVLLLVAVFIVVYCLVPALYLGVGKQADCLKSWFPSITKTSLDEGSWYDYKNQSLFSLVLRFFGQDSPYRVSLAKLTFKQGLIISFILGGFIYLLAVIPLNRYSFNNSVDYSLLFIFMALFNPNAWMHNFIVFIFVYITLFYHLIKVNFRDKITLTLVIFSFILMSLMSESIVGNDLENLFEELSSVAIGAILLLGALFRLKFKGIFLNLSCCNEKGNA